MTSSFHSDSNSDIHPVDPNNKHAPHHSHAYRIESRCLNRRVYADELSRLHGDDLRALYCEVDADLDSLLKAKETFTKQTEADGFHVSDEKDFVEKKLHQIGKKLTIYTKLRALIKDAMDERAENRAVARAELAIQGKLAGLTDAQINALLDPANCVDRLISHSQYTGSPEERRAIMIEDRIAALRSEAFRAEYTSLLSREFDPPELAEIKREAEANADNSCNWEEITAILLKRVFNSF